MAISAHTGMRYASPCRTSPVHAVASLRASRGGLRVLAHDQRYQVRRVSAQVGTVKLATRTLRRAGILAGDQASVERTLSLVAAGLRSLPSRIYGSDIYRNHPVRKGCEQKHVFHGCGVGTGLNTILVTFGLFAKVGSSMPKVKHPRRRSVAEFAQHFTTSLRGVAENGRKWQ